MGVRVPVVRLLGPVDVVDDGGSVYAPRTAVQKTLVALLALETGRVVDPDKLLDQAWDGDPHDSGRRALRFHISQLRKGLPIDGLIATVPGGYRLDADTDLQQVDTLVEDATTTGSPADRLRVLDRALEQWRGEPLLDVADCDAIDGARSRWSERRLVITELRQRARLDTGDHAHVIDELTGILADHPLRESLWALLSEAHYRAGNQDDALRTLRQLRTNLVDELGASPGPADRARRAWRWNWCGDAASANRRGTPSPLSSISRWSTIHRRSPRRSSRRSLSSRGLMSTTRS